MRPMPQSFNDNSGGIFDDFDVRRTPAYSTASKTRPRTDLSGPKKNIRLRRRDSANAFSLQSGQNDLSVLPPRDPRHWCSLGLFEL